MGNGELIGQIFGVVVTALVLITPHLKYKWQMALMSVFANLLSGLNFLLIGSYVGCAIGTVGMTQALLAIRHAKRDTSPKSWELVIFGVLYVFAGLLPFFGAWDNFRVWELLPIVGALLYLLYLAQKKEQHMRYFSLANCTVYLVYDIIIVSTQVFAQLIGIVSVTTALIRYRKKKN